MPVFATYDYIYTGPHTDINGKLDSRIWFSIPIYLNVDDSTITYIIFPYGASAEEINEVAVEV